MYIVHASDQLPAVITNTTMGTSAIYGSVIIVPDPPPFCCSAKLGASGEA